MVTIPFDHTLVVVSDDDRHNTRLRLEKKKFVTRIKLTRFFSFAPRTMRLGVLFLAREGVAHMELWEQWRSEARLEIVFLVHTKGRTPRSSDVYNIAVRVPTRYGHLSIVHAEIELIKEAVRRDCTHCVLVSGDTVPLHAPESVVERIGAAPITITQFGTDEALEAELWRLFDRLGLRYDVLAYHHQFFAMTRVAMDAVVRNEPTIRVWVRRAHRASRDLGFGFATDELWLNFVLQPRRLSRIVFFESVDDRGRVNPSITRHTHRRWPFARKFSPSHAFVRAPWHIG